MAYAAAPPVNRRVEMRFNGPEKQRRWTVLIRLILVIPQAIVLGVLEIALLVVAIIGWFGALFMGRLPAWVHSFNSGYTRWYARYTAYLYLLTDEYPPFDFEDVPYPARPVMPQPGPLNRAAVFFRFILVFPASVFQTIVLYGLLVPMLFVNWLIVLFSGVMPQGLYSAYASWVRYQTRVFAYMLLLTSEYPWGMLGDRTGPGPVAPTAAPGDPAPHLPPPPFTQPPPPAVGTGPETRAPASSAEIPPGEAAVPPSEPDAPAWPPPPPPNWAPPAPSAPWVAAPPPPPQPPVSDAERNRLVLPRGGRRWIVFAIVWGSVLFVAYFSIFAAIGFNNASNRIDQYNTVVNDYNNSKAAMTTALEQSNSCTTVSCLHASHVAAATSLEKFDFDLTAMNLPPNAQGPARVVESDLTQLASAFTDLANSTSPQEYRSTLRTSNLQTLLSSLPNDTNNLLDALRSNIL